MATKYTDLAAAGALDGSEILAVVQGGASKQTTTQDIADLGGGGGGSVVSVTGEFIDNTDPTNPVVTGINAALDLKANELSDPGTAKTSDFALVLTDKDSKGLVIDSATPINVTIPPNSSVAMPRGVQILLESIGVGVPVFVAGAGVTLNPNSGSLNFPADPFTPVMIWQREIDEWDIWNGSPAAGGGTAATTTFTPAGSIAATDVQDAIEELDTEKQAALVSGTNIKTVNGTSILGSGDIDLIDDAIVNGEAKAPSQNAVFDALALKANLASPTFTGTPAAPTPAEGNNTTLVATTEFVTRANVGGDLYLYTTAF